MADRFPLIVDSSTQRVKELASGDNIDLTGSGIVADVFTVDTNSEERLRIDSSGQVGVGLNPGVKFDIDVTNSALRVKSDTSDAQILVTSDDNANAVINFGDESDNDRGSITYDNPNNALIFQANAQARMRIDSSGRLLVGTSTANGYTDRLLTVGDASTSNITAEIRSSSQGQISFSDGVAQDASSYRGLVGYNHGSDYMYLYTNSAERMVIDSSGVVRIGGTATYNGSDKLTLVNNSGNCSLTIDSTTTGESSVFFADGTSGSEAYRGYLQYQHSSDALLIGTAGTQQIVVDSSGRLLLGTITEGHADADDLTLQASSGYTGITLRSSTTHGGAIYFSDATSGAGEYDGQIVYNQNSQSFIFATAQTAQMTIDSSGRIGINNTAPGDLYAERLVVDIGSAAQDGITIKSGTSAQCMLAFADGTSGSTAYAGYIDYNHSSNVLSFGTNGGLERMRIDSSGNVKLNGDSPYIYLSDNDNNWIRGSSSVNAILFGSNNTERMRIDSSGRLLLNSGTDVRIELGTTGTTGTNDRNHLRGDGANLKYNTASGGVHVFEQNGSEAARIDSSGRLLVGTISASLTNKFLLQGDTGSANNGGYMRLQTSNSIVAGTGLGAIGFGDSAYNGALIEATGDTSWSPFTKGSRLLFATTANGASSPTERVRINNQGDHFSYGNTNNVLARVGTTGTGGWIYWGAYGATSISSGTQSFGVYANGNVVNTSNSYGPLSSDERLKQDITNANSQWDDIKNIRITNFHYKNDPTGHLHIGPIAQELEQVSPGLVTRRSVSEEEIADSSNDLTDGDEVLSFKASILYMKAVKALQEAMERIETLEAKVAALEAG